MIPSTEVHTAAEHTENKEPINKDPRRLIPIAILANHTTAWLGFRMVTTQWLQPGSFPYNLQNVTSETQEDISKEHSCYAQIL